MRSMLASGIDARSADDCSFSLMRCPFSRISVFWSPVAPKPRRSICLFGLPMLSRTKNPGWRASSSGIVVTPLSAISPAVITETPIGRRAGASSKRLAVTTMPGAVIPARMSRAFAT